MSTARIRVVPPRIEIRVNVQVHHGFAEALERCEPLRRAVAALAYPKLALGGGR